MNSPSSSFKTGASALRLVQSAGTPERPVRFAGVKTATNQFVEPFAERRFDVEPGSSPDRPSAV